MRLNSFSLIFLRGRLKPSITICSHFERPLLRASTAFKEKSILINHSTLIPNSKPHTQHTAHTNDKYSLKIVIFSNRKYSCFFKHPVIAIDVHFSFPIQAANISVADLRMKSADRQLPISSGPHWRRISFVHRVVRNPFLDVDWTTTTTTMMTISDWIFDDVVAVVVFSIVPVVLFLSRRIFAWYATLERPTYLRWLAG